MSEDVPVDEKNAGMKPHEKEIEEVTACQGNDQVCSRKESHDVRIKVVKTAIPQTVLNTYFTEPLREEA